MAIERVSETVSLGPRPAHVKTSFCSYVQYEGFRRHKAEVTFRPQLSPVKYSDTVYVYINSTRKRYVSRTFYQPRIKPSTYAETEYVCPKTKEEVFVTYLDQTPDENKKWFKTAVEIKARKYRSAHILRSPTDINSNSFTAVDQTLLDQRLADGGSNNSSHSINGAGDGFGALPGNRGSRKFQEIYDPGVSQVYIPKKKDYLNLLDDGDELNDKNNLMDQRLILDFPHSNVDLMVNGAMDEYSDV